MKKVRNLRERICAIVLALAMVLSTILPNATLVANATEPTQVTVEFQAVDSGQSNAELDGLAIKVQKADKSEEEKTVSKDSNGKYTIVLEQGIEYTYSVKKSGYEYSDPTTEKKFTVTENMQPVSVAMKLSEITVKQSSLSLTVGAESTLSVQNPVDGADYVWESENPGVATVDNGRITATGEGSTNIKVSYSDKVTSIPVTVSKNDITLGMVVDPNSGNDVNSVACTVSGLPQDATGTLTFYVNDVEKGSLNIANGVTWNFTEADNIIDAMSFKAVYSGDSKYKNAEVTKSESTFTKTLDLKFSSEIDTKEVQKTMRDDAQEKTFDIELDESTIGNRTIAYTSSNEEVASVDTNGTVTCKKAGKAIITVKAEANSKYAGSTRTYTVIVQKTIDISQDKDSLTWTSSKIYDGNANVSLVAALKGENAVVDKEIKATFEATAESAAVTTSGNATFADAEVSVTGIVDGEEKDLTDYYVFTNYSGETLNSKVTIEPRPVYIQINQEDDQAYESAVSYGTSKEDILTYVKEDNAIVLAGEKGALESDPNTGLVGSDTVDVLKLGENTEITLADDTYYVGTYNTAIVPKIKTEEVGNYKLTLDTESANYYGRLRVNQEVMNDDDIWSVIQADPSQDYSDKGILLPKDDNGVIWVNAYAELPLVTTSDRYDTVRVKGDTSNVLKISEIGKFEDGKIIDVSQTNENGISVYLTNENNPNTRTTSSSGETTANVIPSGKIMIDNQSPTVEFTTLKSLASQLAFTLFKNDSYVETIEVTDGDGSGVKSVESYLLTVVPGESNEDIKTRISEVGKSADGWTEITDNKITVPKEENNYIVLVRATDNVGNSEICASNGIVIDLTNPDITLTIDSKPTVNGVYGGNIEYTITASDPMSGNVQSGINKIDVTVTFGEEVAEAYTLTKTDMSKNEDTDEYTVTKAVNVIDSSKNVTISATAYDSAGNEIDTSIGTLIADSKKPQITVSYDKNAPLNGKYYQERTMKIVYTERDFNEADATFEVCVDGEAPVTKTLEDISGIDGITVEHDDIADDTEYDKSALTYTDDRQVTYRIKFAGDSLDHDYVIKPSVTDCAGNTNEPVVYAEGTDENTKEAFTIDSRLPAIEVKYNLNDAQNEKYFNELRIMTITYTERNFAEEGIAFKVNGSETVSIDDLAQIEGISVQKPDGESTDDKHVYTITFGEENKDYDYNIVPQITDQAGNTNASVSYTDDPDAPEQFTIDMVKPEMSVSYRIVDENGYQELPDGTIGTDMRDSMYQNKTIEAVVSIEERNFGAKDTFKDSVTVAESAKEVDGKTDVVDVKDQGAAAQNLSGWVLEGNKYSQVFVFEEEANYTFNMTYTDMAGNTATLISDNEEGHYFTVDKTAPTGQVEIKGKIIEKILNILTFGFFSKSSITVNTKSSDAISPIKTSYYKDYPGRDVNGEFAALTEKELEELAEDKWIRQSGESDDAPYVISKELTSYTYDAVVSEQFVPYTRIEDKAGNVTYLNHEGVICEKQSSKIGINITTKAPDTTFKVDDENVVYDGDVTFDIHVEDTATKDSDGRDVYSGISSITYEVYTAGNENAETNVAGVVTFEAKERKESYDITDITIPAEDYNSNDIVIKVTTVDNAGNRAEETQPVKIDITDPTIDVSYDLNTDSVNNEKYFNKDRTMTITYTERNINQEGLTFDFAAGEDAEAELLTWDELKAKAADAGFEVVSEMDSQADITDPIYYTDDRTLTLVLRFTGGTQEDKDYYIVPHIEDQAGNKNVTEDADGNVVEVIHYAEGTVAKDTFTIDKVKPTMEVKYYLVDEKGNRGEEIDVSTDEINRLYKNQTVRAIVRIDERNFGYEDAFADGQVKPYFTWTQHDGTPGSTEEYANAAKARGAWSTDRLEPVKRTQSFDFVVDGDYSFNMEYTDLAGNPLETAYKTHYVTVDKTAPVVNVVYEADGKEISEADVEKLVNDRLYKNKIITATVSIDERNFERGDTAERFETDQMQLSYTAKNFEGDAVSTEDYTASADTRGNWMTSVDTQYVRTQVFTFEVDANYEMSLVYKDLAGNECSIGSQKFTVDKTAPTGTITIPDSGEWSSGDAEENQSIWSKLLDIIYDFFVKEKHTSTMTSSDETAGVAGTYYYIDTTATGKKTTAYLTVDELEKKEWMPYTGGITVDANSQSALYEKVVDKAGNVTYLNAARGIIVDNMAPVVKLTDTTPTRNGIHSGDVIVGVEVTDPNPNGIYSGIERVEYTINSTTNQISSKPGTVVMTYNESADERSQTGTGQIKVDARMFNSNDVTVTVTAYDNAGNSYTENIKLKIDISNPVVENITWNTSAASNGKYYNVTRVATITVRERNFDPSQVSLNITNTDGTMPQISGWSVNSSGTSDDNINTCTVTFTADGDYNMSMSCRDLVNNPSNTVTIEEFTIDKTVPTINVTFDNNNAANGKYYNASRTATITVNEHNFNGSEVQTAITSNTVTPGVNGWSGGGDVHTATVPFTTDGNYSFNVNYTDLAGNLAQVYNVDEFVIDLTKPEIEIFDIADKSANNGEVAPGVRYSDTNYDVNGVSITYSGAKHDVKAVDGARSSIPNGESIKMADFEHTAATDDVYTMTAKVTDLAGNYDEKEVMFSVNRFGSNFIFSDETEEFLDDYYNNEEETLVVTEINVDTLTHRGIASGHDGNLTDLEEGTDYTVKESGSEVSWKSYEYTIKKENFEKEGLYNLTIDSVDRATNEVNNKIKEAEIEFVIDKTAPTVVITGVEDEGQYRTNERDITIATADNVAMNRVEVYVDDDKKPAESYNSKTIQRQKGELPYTLTSSSDWQEVKAVAVDMAGNVTDTSRPDGSENEKWLSVLVTSNMFVQFYRNTPLVIGTIIGVVVLGGFIFLILAKRRKDDDEEETSKKQQRAAK